MTKPIDTILIPLTEDSLSLSIIKQISYLVLENDASVFLLYTASTPSNFWRRLFYSRKGNGKWRKEFALFIAFKKQAELELGITINFRVNWGNHKKSVLDYASFIHADTIVLKDDAKDDKWYYVNESPVAYILRKSTCQIITLFTNNDTINAWQNVVLPVTSFIPQARLQTIIKAARAFKIKIHLIGTDHTNSGFYFLTETLKILKSTGNIKVECQYLDAGNSDVNSFLRYCHLVHADALITSVEVKNANKKSIVNKIETMMLHFQHKQPAQPLLHM